MGVTCTVTTNKQRTNQKKKKYVGNFNQRLIMHYSFLNLPKYYT